MVLRGEREPKRVHRQREHGGEEGGNVAVRPVACSRIELQEDVTAVAEARLDALLHDVHHIEPSAQANHCCLNTMHAIGRSSVYWCLCLLKA